MVRLYKSQKGIIHIVQAGYICIYEMGKVESNMRGDRTDITCKNCIARLNC